VQNLRNLILALIYWLAYHARSLVWEIQKPTLIGVRAMVVRGDEVLLIRHRSGATPWALPGGGVEKHERMAEAARREAFEESGVPVRVEGVLGLYDSFRGTVSNYIGVFICAPLGEPNPPESLEIAEARFFPIRALPPETDAGTKRRVAEFLDGAMGITDLW
jgi:ADP-ribose pyrophosphatase YjhB (NUDIX family)